MDAKWTRAPWRTEPQGGKGAWIQGMSGEWAALACGDTHETAAANARLIAAAPDLYEALLLAEDVLSRAPFSTQMWPTGVHPNDGITKIRAALAKADLWGR